MKLDDSAIAHIAKALQVAILTGTDVVDNFRQLEFVSEDNTLFIDSNCADNFEKNLQKLLNDAASLNSDYTK
jgi:hypothetical protein